MHWTNTKNERRGAKSISSTPAVRLEILDEIVYGQHHYFKLATQANNQGQVRTERQIVQKPWTISPRKDAGWVSVSIPHKQIQISKHDHGWISTWHFLWSNKQQPVSDNIIWEQTKEVPYRNEAYCRPNVISKLGTAINSEIFFRASVSSNEHRKRESGD